MLMTRIISRDKSKSFVVPMHLSCPIQESWAKAKLMLIAYLVV